MSIALYSTESLPLESIASALAEEGLSVQAFSADEIRTRKSFGPEITLAVLIVPKHGAGDQTAWFSRLLTGGRQMILCTQQPENEGYEKLKSVGAATVITPRSWAPAHVAERILGQLILYGEVTPFTCGGLRGATKSMRNVYNEISVVAPLTDPVLITGESGTGKELCAQEIHQQSGRSKLVPINCGALSNELISSDLFGHKKGSFTGATDARQGLLSDAGEGTVLLDEIGELDLKAQAVLLRVLEEKKVRRVGANQPEAVPARILFATNRDLDFECEAGRFRKDLLERIRVFTLELVPLRYRRADIPLLAELFLSEFSREHDRSLSIPPGTFDCMFNYDWPGNVRELRSAIRNAAAFADANGLISARHLTQRMRRGRSSQASTPEHYVAFDPREDTWKKFSERAHAAYFHAVLDVAGGNKKEARRVSGLGSSQFYENLKTISPLGNETNDE